MDTRLIKMFGVVLENGADPKEEALSFQAVNTVATRAGYIVPEDACNQSVMDFLEEQEWNPNSTFYRTWQDVQSKTRWELFMDQIFHYASTYGTDFQGQVYCPNGEPIPLDYKSYKVIIPVTAEELYQRCLDMLASGIALSSDTVSALTGFIIWAHQNRGKTPDLDVIANREAQAILSSALNIWPSRGEDIVRTMYYRAMGESMIIQSPSKLEALYRTAATTWDSSRFSLEGMGEKEILALSQVFYRYKKVLLAWRRASRDNKKIINRVRNLAIKNHQPMVKGFWENFTNFEGDLDDPDTWNTVLSHIRSLDNCYKIVRLIQMIRSRQYQNAHGTHRAFVIRNNTVFLDRTGHRVVFNTQWEKAGAYLAARLVELLSQRLHELYKKDTIYIKYPDNLDLACPVSEKKFFGPFPYGTSWKLENQDSFLGIYWESDWGTRDYDLSFLYTKKDGQWGKIGWNGQYYDRVPGLSYSGDMTMPNPAAAEIIHIARPETPIEGAMMVNRYSGDPDSKIRLFFGRGQEGWQAGDAMIQPDDIDMEVTGRFRKNMALMGVVADGRFFLDVQELTQDRVSRVIDKDFDKWMGFWKDRAASYVPLKTILDAVPGVKEWIDPATAEENDREVMERLKTQPSVPDLDLSALESKDVLISLFSKTTDK